MKQIIIMIIILIIIFGGAWYIQKFLDDTTNNLVSKLEILKKDIDEEKEEELDKNTNQIYGEWKDISQKWSIIVLHDELDLIETSLIKVKSKIQAGNLDESIEDIDTSIFLLKHIGEKEKTSLKNIF